MFLGASLKARVGEGAPWKVLVEPFVALGEERLAASGISDPLVEILALLFGHPVVARRGP